jgi:hypothetical protein
MKRRSAQNYRKNFILTINVPLILKMGEIIFFAGHFKGYFEGAKTFLTPKLSITQTLCPTHALFVPLTRKMREIWKLGMDPLLP